MRDTFNSRMDAAKAKAADRRSRGFTTGKAAKGHVFKRPSPEGHARVIAEIKSGWRHMRIEAIEQYRFDVFGDQWEGL